MAATETAKRVRTSTVPANEGKGDKFKRLAVSRTSKALDAIASLSGLTNTVNYEYTPEQWVTIMSALETEMTKLANKIKNPTAVAETGFTL